jgi:hypothetical protein
MSMPAATSRQGRTPARNDLIVMAAGAAVFIASFLPWFGISLGIVSATQNAWHSLLGIVPVLLAAAVAGAVAAETYSGFRLPAVRRRQPKHVLAAGSALAFLLLILRMIFIPGGSYYAGVVGPRYGVFLALAAAAVQVFFAAQTLKASQAQARSGKKVPS